MSDLDSYEFNSDDSDNQLQDNSHHQSFPSSNALKSVFHDEENKESNEVNFKISDSDNDLEFETFTHQRKPFNETPHIEPLLSTDIPKIDFPLNSSSEITELNANEFQDDEKFLPLFR